MKLHVENLSLLEMTKIACAELGVPYSSLIEVKTASGSAVRWASAQYSPKLLKAARLAILKKRGPNSMVVCIRHLNVSAHLCCSKITVAEALLYPDMSCDQS